MSIYGAQKLTQRSAQGRTQHAVAMLTQLHQHLLCIILNTSLVFVLLPQSTLPHNKDRISLVNNQHIMTSSCFKQWWYELTTSSHSSSPHPLIPSSPHPLIPSSPHPLIPSSPHPLIPSSPHPLIPSSPHPSSPHLLTLLTSTLSPQTIFNT